jgi:hypothetical protein
VHRFLFIFLLALAESVTVCPAKADTEKPLYAPRPQLSGSTWNRLRFDVPHFTAVACITSISVEEGAVGSVTMSQSTGLKKADDEICDWIKRKWRFDPKVSGTYKVPLVLYPDDSTVYVPREWQVRERNAGKSIGGARLPNGSSILTKLPAAPTKRLATP